MTGLTDKLSCVGKELYEVVVMVCLEDYILVELYDHRQGEIKRCDLAKGGLIIV